MLFRKTQVDEYFGRQQVRVALRSVALSFLIPAVYLIGYLDQLFFSYGSLVGWLSVAVAFGPAFYFSRKLQYVFDHFISRIGLVLIGFLLLGFVASWYLASTFEWSDIAKRATGTILSIYGAYVACKASKSPELVDDLRRDAISRTWN